MHQDAKAFHSPAVHLLQQQDESSAARKSFHPTYGTLFLQWQAPMKSVPFQS